MRATHVGRDGQPNGRHEHTGSGIAARGPTIVVVDSSIAMTGAFRAVSNAAKALTGHADIILALPRGAAIDPSEFGPFKRVIELPIRTIRRSVRDLLLYGPALLSSTLALRKLLREEATHLFVNDFVLMHGAALRLLGYRGFVGAWVRMNPAAYPAALSRVFLKNIWASSDRIIAVSKHAMAAVPPAPQLRHIYDPVGSPPIEGKAESSDNKIVYIANYIRGKGQEHAIAAFVLVAARFPQAELHFWGGDMGLDKNRRFRRELEIVARSGGIGDRVRFHGFTDEPNRVLANAAVALNFSEAESLSLTCIEASLAGVPVIATRCGGPEEIVIDGETGYLVSRGDVPAMATRIADLLDDVGLARRMGEAGAAFSRRTFAPQVFRQAFLDAIDVDAIARQAPAAR